ncbi:hypothetical protein VCRA2122O265_70137 [Vibrio crassostreae]|nr:hypothetical protein VCRA2118O239_70138 [Vibrio crassostreae]CAK2384218.1 hypothetical protein VCRA2113O217_70139 [Vibrio crassostreae]CAK2554810.1 hypothetical protein VCRA2119O243_60138 [Vibrio crassostreae]CAK3010135.1 hypothetical protein VCRA2119O242_70098 [Vibrio crassostreae]CAK3012744.1 hypothetical protein VCRA2117O235_70137 [Vibrio crassostreae]
MIQTNCDMCSTNENADTIHVQLIIHVTQCTQIIFGFSDELCRTKITPK